MSTSTGSAPSTSSGRSLLGGTGSAKEEIKKKLRGTTKRGLPSVSKLTFSDDFNLFLSLNGLMFSVESQVVYLMMLNLYELYPNSIPFASAGKGKYGYGEKIKNQRETDGHWWDLETADLPDWTPSSGFTNQDYLTMMGTRADALQWLVDLTACHQIKSLNAENIASYFASFSMEVNGRYIIMVLSVSINILDNIISDREYRDMLSENQFMKYHTSATSTPGLVKQMIDAFPNLSKELFTDEELDAVRVANEEYWDADTARTISTRLIVATHVYLEVFDRLPKGWFQGAKAMALCQPNLPVAYNVIFKKMKSITANVTDLEAANTEAEVLRAIPNYLRAKPAEDASLSSSSGGV